MTLGLLFASPFVEVETSGDSMNQPSFGWGNRARRTSGNLKPRKLDEQKLAFLREAYEPDEEHLVAEALFDLANMYGEEDEEDEGGSASAGDPSSCHGSPPLNGKRTRKGLPTSAHPFSQLHHQQHPKLTRTYSQQRASPLPHNTHRGSYSNTAASSLQQLTPQQQPQQQPQQHTPTVGQAAHASTHPQLHANGLAQHPYYSASGLPGSGPFFMPPYPHMQLPPGALSGKLATTMLPNGNPVPLAFGPNGALVPLSGAWPHGLLHPQQHQQHPTVLAQHLHPHLGLAAQQVGRLPSGGTTVSAGLGMNSLPLTQQLPQRQGAGVKLEDGLPDAGPQGDGANLDSTLKHSKPQLMSAFAAQSQQGALPDCAKQGIGTQSEAGLKRCALHVRIAHMIMDRQRQHMGGTQRSSQQEPNQQQGASCDHPQNGSSHRHGSASSPSAEQNGSMVRQHSAGSTSTCPSAPSALADTNTSPASTRVPHSHAVPNHSRGPAVSSPGKEATATNAMQQAQPSPTASTPAAEQSARQPLGSTAQNQPAPAARPVASSSNSIQSYSVQQQQQLQQLVAVQRLHQLQQQAAGTSSPFPFAAFQQGLPILAGISQPPLSAAHLPSLAGLPGISPHLASYGLQGLQQPHLHHQLPHQSGVAGFAGSMGLQQAGLPPHLLMGLGLPGLILGYPLESQNAQPFAPGMPAYSFPPASQAMHLQQQQQQQQQQHQQGPQQNPPGMTSLAAGKHAPQGPRVH